MKFVLDPSGFMCLPLLSLPIRTCRMILFVYKSFVFEPETRIRKLPFDGQLVIERHTKHEWNQIANQFKPLYIETFEDQSRLTIPKPILLSNGCPFKQSLALHLAFFKLSQFVTRILHCWFPMLLRWFRCLCVFHGCFAMHAIVIPLL